MRILRWLAALLVLQNAIPGPAVAAVAREVSAVSADPVMPTATVGSVPNALGSLSLSMGAQMTTTLPGPALKDLPSPEVKVMVAVPAPAALQAALPGAPIAAAPAAASSVLAPVSAAQALPPLPQAEVQSAAEQLQPPEAPLRPSQDQSRQAGRSLLQRITAGLSQKPKQSLDAAFDGSQAEALQALAPKDVVVYLTGKDGAPTVLALGQLQEYLSANPAALNRLQHSGRVRMVAAKGDEKSTLTLADAAAVARLLASYGLDKKIAVETMAVDLKQTDRAQDLGAGDAAPQELRTPGTGEKTLAVLASPLREAAFLWRNFRASLTRPAMSEIVGTLLTRIPSVLATTAWLTKFYLPGGHAAAFAVNLVALLALWTFHGIWVDSWNNFQDSLARQKGITYQTVFNLVYGQLTGALLRVIAWTAIAGTIPPWSLHYWRDMGIMTVIGTFFGTLGQQGVNALYEKGIIPRWGRSGLWQGRQLLFSLGGVLLQTGAMSTFWSLFAMNQGVDLMIFLAGKFLPRRDILTLASAPVAASIEFQGRFSVKPVSQEPVWKQAAKAVAQSPFLMPFVLLARWLKGLATKEGLGAAVSAALAAAPADALAQSYVRALAGAPAAARSAALAEVPLLSPLLGEDGKPKAVRKDALIAPVFYTESDGSLGVFKPALYVPADDPEYPFLLMKLMGDVIGSIISEKMGVPTVPYRMARMVLDGKEVIGAASPYLRMTTLHDSPELAGSISNKDAFVRGAIIDAWLGNIDRILNHKNIWLRDDGKGGTEAVFGDFNQALKQGVSVLGVPKVPVRVLPGYLGDEKVADATLAEITALSDENIAALVDEAVARTYGLGAASRDYIVALLDANRDQLKTSTSWARLKARSQPRVRLSPEAAGALAQAVLDRYRDAGKTPDAWVEASLKNVIVLWERPELKPIMRGMLEEAVRNRMAGKDREIELRPEQLDVLEALMNFVYMEVDPAVAIAARIGHHK
jgi:hypothetical protein